MSLLLRRMFDPRSNIAALTEAVSTLARYKELVLEMTRRELLDRYAGTALGGVWVFGAPLLLLAVYVFAFMYVMRLRLGAGDSGLQFALFVLSGLTPWLALQDALGRAPSAVVGSANLVKQIVFPSEILPLKVALATYPSLLVGIIIVVIGSLMNDSLGLFALFVLTPIALLFYFVLITGFVYALASLGVFLRDIKDITGLLLAVGLFLHPVLYPPATVPNWVEQLFMFSPFSHLIWCFRDALFYGAITRPGSWVLTPVLGVLFFVVGWRIFRMLRPSFGNAL
jgi:homopolymeric O-antigen transport system permease protein